jgi:2-iminobutanoate/2-iminopropanoate deaminase
MVNRWLLPLLLFVPAVSSAQQTARVYVKSKLAESRHLPFSDAVLVGNTLYISGKTGVESGTKGSVSAEEQARLVMDQVKQIVKQAGMKMDDIVLVQVFCTDMKDYDVFNRVYKTYFHGQYPARAFIGVSDLRHGARYEVTAIAIRHGHP